MLELDAKTTALVLIDLQKGIMRHELKPYPADRVTKAGPRISKTP
jgi:nicotinamidase-related amidase